METNRTEMLRRLAVFPALAVAGLLAGCFVSPVMPPIGFIYHQTNVPVDLAFDETSIGPRTGSAESMSILGLVAIGDARIETAARNGNVAVVQHVDAELFNVLGVYQRYTTHVRGLSAAEALSLNSTTTESEVAGF